MDLSLDFIYCIILIFNHKWTEVNFNAATTDLLCKNAAKNRFLLFPAISALICSTNKKVIKVT